MKISTIIIFNDTTQHSFWPMLGMMFGWETIEEILIPGHIAPWTQRNFLSGFSGNYWKSLLSFIYRHAYDLN